MNRSLGYLCYVPLLGHEQTLLETVLTSYLNSAREGKGAKIRVYEGDVPVQNEQNGWAG